MRKLIGTVVSAKMKKTVVVSVPLIREEKKYQKTYTVKRRFKSHAEEGICALGDEVVIQEVPPMSRDKRWRVVEKIKTNDKQVPTKE